MRQYDVSNHKLYKVTVKYITSLFTSQCVYGLIYLLIVLKLRYVGLNFKLDVGLYRLDQQVACQRHRHISIDAKTASLSDMVDRVFAGRQAAPALA